jgi:hypothetical protein
VAAQLKGHASAAKGGGGGFRDFGLRLFVRSRNARATGRAEKRGGQAGARQTYR